MIRQFILALTVLASACATPWNTTLIDSGGGVGVVSGSAVDAAGRVHFFSVSEDPAAVDSYELNHIVRASGSSGLNSDAFAAVPAAERPLHASMTVTANFRIQVAVLTAAGSVEVWERADEGGSWEKTVVGSCSTDLFAGVSLQRSRGRETTRSAVVFTGASGGVRFSEQQGDGSWREPRIVSNGIGAGLAPVLVHTGISSAFRGFPSRVVISYNQTENQIEANSFERVGPGGLYDWSSAERVARAFTPTRPDAVGYGDKVGVAFVSNADSSTFSQIVRVQYAASTFDLSGGGGWEDEDVALGTEVEDDDEYFGGQAALAFDAAGEPIVGYQRVLVGIDVARTIDIRVRRHVPGLGWKLDVVEEVPVAGTGIYATDYIGLTAGDNGDPVLTYERDGGASADSALVFARPVAAPWVLGKPDSLAEFGYSSAPAVCTSESGAVHLLTNVGVLQSFFGAPVAFYKAPLVTTYDKGVVTSEQLPAPDTHHAACGIATDAGGAIHAVVLRLTDVEEGTLHYYKREPGGMFMEVGSSIPTGGPVERKPISVGAADDGRVFVAYHPADGGFGIDAYDPARGTWGAVLGLGAVGIEGMDLAVRGDGEFALTYFSYPSGGIAGDTTMLTTVEPSTGERINGPDRSESFIVETGLALTGNTSCAFGDDGRPRFAYLNAGVITLVRPDADTPTGFALARIERGDDEGLPELIELAHSGRTTHILAGTTDAGGGLRYFRMPAGGSFTGELVAETGLEFNRTSGLSSSPRDPIALTLDQFGEPIVAIATTEPALAGATVERVILARPADFTDTDGDRIPLLLEGAHCLDSSLKNYPTDTARTLITVWEEFTDIRHLFRVPAAPLRSTSRGIAFGEFEFVDESSSDLVTWGPPAVPAPAGISHGVFGPTPDPDDSACAIVGLTTLIQPASLAADARYFTRLRVSRDR